MLSGPPRADSRPPIEYFAEAVPGTETLRLAAAIVRRGVPTARALRGGHGPLGWLRGVRHRLWMRLGPRGLDVSVAGRPLFGGTRRAARSIGIAAAAPHAEPLAYYDSGARVLRVLGRVFHAPDQGTLVALIDATGQRAAAPRLVLRVVPTPGIPLPRFDDLPPQEVAGVAYLIGGKEPAWDTALRECPHGESSRTAEARFGDSTLTNVAGAGRSACVDARLVKNYTRP